MSSPQVGQESIDAIRAAVDGILDELDYQLTAVYGEERMVEPSSLRVDPNSGSGVGLPGWSPQAIRAQIGADATALGGIATRITTGALSSYLSADEMARAESLRANAQQIWNYVQSLDTAPIPNVSDSQAHLALHLSGLNGAVAEAEKAVVVAESGSVPVIEPYERTSKSLKTALAVAGAGILLAIIGILS